MRVFINAISIVEGGGLVVLKNLLEEMQTQAPYVQWYLAANYATLSHTPQSEFIIKLPFSWTNKSPWHLVYWYEFVLPKLLHQTRAEVCFSQTNFLPRRRLPCASLLLVHHAGYFSKKFQELNFQWNKKNISKILWEVKCRWVKSSIKRATRVTVQTQALASQIIAQTNIPKEKIIVIPHGTGLLKFSTQLSRSFPVNYPWRIGYITKFGVQKDFDTAFKAIRLLKNALCPVKLILTLNETRPEFSYLMTLIHDYDIEDLIENHGEISCPEKLKELYASLHIFIFTSLCESFGFTLVEAMASGLPIIAADTQSNCEIVNDVNQLFTAESEIHLAEKILRFTSAKELYENTSKTNLVRSQEFSWEKTAKNMLQVLYGLRESKHEKG